MLFIYLLIKETFYLAILFIISYNIICNSLGICKEEKNIENEIVQSSPIFIYGDLNAIFLFIFQYHENELLAEVLFRLRMTNTLEITKRAKVLW